MVSSFKWDAKLHTAYDGMQYNKVIYYMKLIEVKWNESIYDMILNKMKHDMIYDMV